MASIHVNRGGTSVGVFPENEVRDGLISGKFQTSDLGWREGMETWKPLGEFAEFAAAAGSAAVPPGEPAASGPITSVPVVVETIPRSGLPWDRRHELGLAAAFFETLKLVLTQPNTAFKAMRTEGGFAEPLIYAVIGGSVGFISYILWMLLMSSFGVMADQRNMFGHLIGRGFGLVVFIIFVPVFIAIGAFVSSAIIHLCLMLVGGAKRPYETTFRVICYAMGSAHPLMIVPFCGNLIAGVWAIVLECLGLARAHEIDTGRAVLAVLLPVIICCGGSFIFGMVFGLMGGLMSGQH